MVKKKLGLQELSKASKATLGWQAQQGATNKRQATTTTTERVFSASSKLISVTDIHGVIVDCNAAFVQVSGYSKAELLGQPHNIVRHPDMPAEAFKIMWQHLQAGKPWMGLVKNLCKNGDYYWVDAYITPITVKGQVVGYESVRSCPSRAAVHRAQKVYDLIQAKKSLLGWSVFKNDWIELLVLALATAGWLGWATTATQMLSGSLVLVGAYALVAKWRTRKALTAIEAHLAQSFSHPIAALTYIGDTSRLSQIKVGLLSQKAHLATVLTRIENAASQLHQKTAQTLDLTQTSQQQISLQQAETAQVVALMQQMTSALMVVATQVTNAAQETDKAHVYIVRCNSIAQQTHAAIDELSQRVQSIRGSVVAVAEQINKITHSAQTIEQIADQTNLLALNAAIEAARAGDNGRGFAVVADEVRSLASVTQTSTQEIYTVLQELTTKAAEAVSVASLGAKQADQGLSNVAENSTMLNNIAQTVSQISNQASQVATVVEQQSAVAADINQQLNTIDALAVESCTSALQTNQSLQHLQQVADDLHELVSRFRE